MEKSARIHDMEMALRVALSVTHPDSFLTAKSMFGGAGFFVDGRIFAAWFGKELTLKLPEDTAQELLEIDGTARADADKYIELPSSWLDDTKKLQPWVARSVEFALSVPAKKRRKS